MKALSLALLLAVAGLSSIQGAREEDPTYVKHVAPVFAQKCVPCHTEGGVGPFPLENYKQVKGRSALIRYVLLQGKMPPLAADSDLGNLRTIHRMADRELLMFQDWVRAGGPEGTGTPPEVKKTEWRLGEPDQVITGGSSYSVNAEGAPYSVDIRVPLDYKETRKVRAIDFRPKNGKVWRRAIIARAYPADQKKPIYNPLGLPSSRLIGSWGLGANVWQLPANAGIELKPGDELAVIPLWQPSGRKETGEFEIALYFDDAAPKTAEWQTMGSADFVIPPQDGFTDLEATTTLADDVEMISILPEARLYARLIRLVAKLPNGHEHVLFMVRNWSSEWAGSYNFEKPVPLPKGTRLELTMTYDNSGHALGEVRKDPPALKFGPGPNDELFWLHYQFVKAG